MKTNRSAGAVRKGNDGESGYEGVVYKNVIGTYLHGPLLPKNPQIADYLILKALERKYKRPMELKALPDEEESRQTTIFITGL